MRPACAGRPSSRGWAWRTSRPCARAGRPRWSASRVLAARLVAAEQALVSAREAHATAKQHHADALALKTAKAALASLEGHRAEIEDRRAAPGRGRARRTGVAPGRRGAKAPRRAQRLCRGAEAGRDCTPGRGRDAAGAETQAEAIPGRQERSMRPRAGCSSSSAAGGGAEVRALVTQQQELTAARTAAEGQRVAKDPGLHGADRRAIPAGAASNRAGRGHHASDRGEE